MTLVETTPTGVPPERKIRICTIPETVALWPDLWKKMQEQPELWERTVDKKILYERLAHGMLGLMVAAYKSKVDLYVLYEVVKYPRAKFLEVVWAAGEYLDEHVNNIDVALNYLGQEKECDFITVHGRAGWKKKLEPLGYSLDHIVLSRPVAKGVLH